MEDGVIFDIRDHVGRLLRRYPESVMNIPHGLAEEKFVPGVGGIVWGLVGLVGVFSKFKDRIKPITSI